MKARELRELTNEELYTKLEESHQELFNLRFQLTTRQLTNHCRITEVRRTVARIHTILRERELSSVAWGQGEAEPAQEVNSLAG